MQIYYKKSAKKTIFSSFSLTLHLTPCQSHRLAAGAVVRDYRIPHRKEHQRNQRRAERKLTIIYGIALVFTDAQPIGGFQKIYTQLITGRIGNSAGFYIPYLLIIAAVFGVLFWIIYNKKY